MDERTTQGQITPLSLPKFKGRIVFGKANPFSPAESRVLFYVVVTIYVVKRVVKITINRKRSAVFVYTALYRRIRRRTGLPLAAAIAMTRPDRSDFIIVHNPPAGFFMFPRHSERGA